MLNEQVGNIWDFHDKNNWVVVTTNSTIKNNGTNVMGGGIAKEAAKRYPKLPRLVAEGIERWGNIPLFFPDITVATLPTKNDVWLDSTLELVIDSASKFAGKIDLFSWPAIYHIPRPGCGLGGLDWETVKPEMEAIFGNRKDIVFWSY